MDGRQIRQLQQLARLYGVQTSFHNVKHERQWATPDGLLAALRALGAQVAGLDDLTEARRQHRRDRWQRVLEPVTVVWGQNPVTLSLRLPEEHLAHRIAGTWELENGEPRSVAVDTSAPMVTAAETVDGRRYVLLAWKPPGRLPWGYHRLILEWAGQRAEALVVAAPEVVYSPRGKRFRSQWGVFAPLYALHSTRSWGSGDFTDGEALVEWTAAHGGALVGTLPLLATFLDFPCDPSPYTPASRMFWSEFFIDVTRLPELESCPEAQAMIAEGEFQRELAEWNAAPTVDYRRQMARKRQVLACLSRYLFSRDNGRREELRRHLETHPELDSYARFRAAMHRRQTRWPQWPSAERDGQLPDQGGDRGEWQYHVYAQFVAEEQVAAWAQRATERNVGLYFDLPLGVHADGYDIWRHQDLFATDVSVGAPPDAFFPNGQDWSFPPWRPQAMRQSGYAYLIACLRHHLRHARMLRLDHIMGLHRFFWIPRGGDGNDGVYVRYPSDEIYAVLSVESHRHQAILIGENLGTVPGYVNRAMHRHGMAGISVVLHDMVTDPEGTKRRLARSPRTVVCLGTHDMYPFAAYWRDIDLQERERLGIITSDAANWARGERPGQRERLAAYLRGMGLLGEGAGEREILRAILSLLARSAVQTVLVNIEDLWLETVSQNVPGTTDEHANWQLKTRLSLEEFTAQPEIIEMLTTIDDLRREARSRARAEQR
ncbi:MAG: 4-alpha-glucanotransferase [Candidatus Zixiibacteriota bacterium]